MSKTLEEAPLTTRSAREKLGEGVHWRSVDRDVHLGYRKSVRTGRWIVRWREGTGYKQAKLGVADDVLKADGQATYSFDQAWRGARDFVERTRAEASLRALGPVPTVRDVCEAYAAALEARQVADGVRARRDSRSRVNKHILAGKIAAITICDLTAADILAWRTDLQSFDLAAATVKRTAAVLRAALNEAGRQYCDALGDRYFMAVRNGFAATTIDHGVIATRPNVVLSDDDFMRLMQAAAEIDEEGSWDGHLLRLVTCLAITGARFSQVARIKVGDLQLDRRQLMVPVSRKGRGRKARTAIAFPLDQSAVEVLRPAVAGRRGQDLLLQRWAFTRLESQTWRKSHLRAWRPAEITMPFRKIVDRAQLSLDVTAYALRHTSIARGLRLNMPVRLVASMHDTSTEMIERHYSAHIEDAMRDVARLAAVPLHLPQCPANPNAIANAA
jgi:integrase